MLWTKKCSRCSGDLHMDSDMYGQYIDCLQCGYILSDIEQFTLLHPREVHRITGEKERQMAKAA